MDLDELLEQFKMLTVWHKGVTITAAALLAVMIGFVIWGITAEEIRTLLIVAGSILGVCGAGLFVTVHLLYNKTKKVFTDYFKASKMSEEEIRSLLDKHQIKEI